MGSAVIFLENWLFIKKNIYNVAKSLQLPYANKAKFWPIMVKFSCGGHLWEVRLHIHTLPLEKTLDIPRGWVSQKQIILLDK